MTDWQRVELSGPTSVGEVGALPDFLVGLTLDTLTDLSLFASAYPDLDGVGYWPVVDLPLPTPGLGQTIGQTPGMSIDAELKHIGRSYEVEFLPLAERKAVLKEAITEEFRRRRNGGTTASIGGFDVEVSTTHEAAVELDRAIAKITRTNPAGTIPVVTRGKARVTLTAAIATDMLRAIEDHVAACQENENSLYGEVDDAETQAALTAIDIMAGWP
jgi:hypothetical protein